MNLVILGLRPFIFCCNMLFTFSLCSKFRTIIVSPNRRLKLLKLFSSPHQGLKNKEKKLEEFKSLLFSMRFFLAERILSFLSYRERFFLHLLFLFRLPLSDVSLTEKPTEPTNNFPNRTEGFKKFWPKLKPTNRLTEFFSFFQENSHFLRIFPKTLPKRSSNTR